MIARQRFAGRIGLLAMLVTHSVLLAWGAWRHSPNVDETAHLASGVSHWQFGRFDLYRVNPPLVRMVAAIPVLALHPQTNWERFSARPGLRCEFVMGDDFVEANGFQSFWLFTVARWACIPFSLLGALACYQWSRECFGRHASLLAAALWCFSPDILAHGQLITPDTGAAAFGACAGYANWKWLRTGQWSHAIATGIALGGALLCKTTLVLLLFSFVAIRLLLPGQMKRAPLHWLQVGGQTTLMLAISGYILNLGYGFDGSMMKLGEHDFVSSMLKGEKDQPFGNRFRAHWTGSIPIPLPKDYLLGIDLQKHGFDSEGRPSYLHGEFRNRGWWYYYVYAVLVKTPCGTMLLALLAAVTRAKLRGRHHGFIDDVALLLPAFVIFVAVSSQTGFSRHLRYILPAYPFAIIWISRVARCAQIVGSDLKWLAMAASIWMIVSSLLAYPHSLSYFNELAGGPRNGHSHLLGSNLDWGQDLLYLKEWIDENPNARPMWVAFYGGVDPRVAGIECKPPPAHLQPGWYAISVNLWKGYPWPIPDQDGNVISSSERFKCFAQLKPVMMIGYSIYIFHVIDNSKDETTNGSGMASS